jgi:hypothetical protein
MELCNVHDVRDLVVIVVVCPIVYKSGKAAKKNEMD